MKHIKHIYSIFCIFLFSVIFFSCDEINNVNDFSGKYTFLCVLKNDQVIQKAYIHYVTDLKQSLSHYSPNADFIHDAEITISDAVISSQLKVRHFYTDSYIGPDWPSRMYMYAYSDDSIFYGNILPNKKYDLQLKVNNEVITGSTVTPGDFSINTPINNTIEIDKDADKNDIKNFSIYKYRLSWSKSANSFGYVIYSTVIYKNIYGLPSGYPLYHGVEQTITSTDTFAIIDIYKPFPGIDVVLYPDGKKLFMNYPDSAKFVVIAVDKNYHDYFFLSRDRAGISSQYGVFGSSIADSCVVQIKYQDD